MIKPAPCSGWQAGQKVLCVLNLFRRLYTLYTLSLFLAISLSRYLAISDPSQKQKITWQSEPKEYNNSCARWCWNWQTGMVEGHVAQAVGVRFPPSAQCGSFQLPFFVSFFHFYRPIGRAAMTQRLKYPPLGLSSSFVICNFISFFALILECELFW